MNNSNINPIRTCDSGWCRWRRSLCIRESLSGTPSHCLTELTQSDHALNLGQQVIKNCVPAECIIGATFRLSQGHRRADIEPREKPDALAGALAFVRRCDRRAVGACLGIDLLSDSLRRQASEHLASAQESCKSECFKAAESGIGRFPRSSNRAYGQRPVDIFRTVHPPASRAA